MFCVKFDEMFWVLKIFQITCTLSLIFTVWGPKLKKKLKTNYSGYFFKHQHILLFHILFPCEKECGYLFEPQWNPFYFCSKFVWH